jgi:tryptophan 7-halogenase
VSAVRELVIVGRDAPLWLSACVMQYALAPAGVNITVVELPGEAQPADVAVSLPALEPLHTRLGIDESRLIAATRGAFSLGRSFVDAMGGVRAFFHPHGAIGTRIDHKEFLPHWILARRSGLDVALEDFSLTATAARHGRMLLPDAEIESFGFSDYAYHLPAIPYREWLKQLALRRGVRVLQARSVDPLLDPSSGWVAGLRLDGAHAVAGEFFLDVSGDDRVLMRALGVRRESWRQDFAADRVLHAHAAPLSPLPIYSEFRACATGWVGLAASQVCTHVVHAFSSGQVGDAEALAMARRIALMDLQGVVVRAREPGRLESAWQHNCVAIGSAACVFDAMHFVDLHAVQVGLVHLLPLFPVAAEHGAERVEYNHNMRASFERLRDFQAAHYLLNRYDSPFWSRARGIGAGAELMHKIDAFRARGEVVYYEDESFMIDDWQSLLIGHGVMPETQDPAVERTPPVLVKSELQRILGFIRRKVEQQRSHAQYLRG